LVFVAFTDKVSVDFSVRVFKKSDTNLQIKNILFVSTISVPYD